MVTIVTPTNNRAHLLKETIESVLAQDYSNLEYIVLDDGSTDGTTQLLETYGDRIRWVRHPNMGEQRTVNRGWQMARGEFICTLNSDDLLVSGAAREAAQFLIEHPEVMCVYPDWAGIDLNSKPLFSRKTREYDYLRMIREQFCNPGPGAFFRRRVIDQIGFRNPKYMYAADFEFWLRLGLVGPMARLPRELAMYRSHPNCLSVTGSGNEMAEERGQLIRDFFKRADLPAEVLAVKRQAVGSAYARANEIMRRKSYLSSLGYFLKSICWDPRYWLRFNDRQVVHRLFRVLMPVFVYRLAKGVWNRIRRVKWALQGGVQKIP